MDELSEDEGGALLALEESSPLLHSGAPSSEREGRAGALLLTERWEDGSEAAVESCKARVRRRAAGFGAAAVALVATAACLRAVGPQVGLQVRWLARRAWGRSAVGLAAVEEEAAKGVWTALGPDITCATLAARPAGATPPPSWDAGSLRACLEECERLVGRCTGAQFEAATGLCELWTEPLGAGQPQDGVQCHRLDAGRARAPKPCYRPVGDTVGHVAEEPGRKVGDFKIVALSDCVSICNKMPDCKSFTACDGTRRCSLHDKALAVDAPTKRAAGCQTFTQASCDEVLPGPPAQQDDRNLQRTPPDDQEDAVWPPAVPGHEEDLIPPPAATDHEEEDDLFPLSTAPDDKADLVPQPTAPNHKVPKNMDRSKFVWTPFQGFDLEGQEPIGEMAAAGLQDLGNVKSKCLELICAGFSLAGGFARLYNFSRPLQRADLTKTTGKESVLFFTFGPPRKLAWEAWPHYTIPQGMAAEELHVTNRATIERYAEAMGYHAFTLNRETHTAQMQRTDMRLRSSEMEFLGPLSPITLYQAVPEKPKALVPEYFNKHMPFRSGCSDAGQNCLETECCSDPGLLCFRRDRALGECLAACRRGMRRNRSSVPWTCEVVGKVKIPGLALLCWGLAKGPEDMRLAAAQADKRIGIGGCDEAIVFTKGPTKFKSRVQNYQLPIWEARTGPGAGDGELSARTFYEAWMHLVRHYLWRLHDWTVKVDFATVFWPNQLKVVLKSHADTYRSFDQGRGVYLATCTEQSSMTASLEVVAMRGVASFIFHGADFPSCSPPVDSTTGEVEWLQGCLDDLGTIGVQSPGLLADERCAGPSTEGASVSRAPVHRDAAEPCHHSKVAVYPKLVPDAWGRCWDEAYEIRV